MRLRRLQRLKAPVTNLFERSFLQLHDEPKHTQKQDDIPGVTAMIKSILEGAPEWKGKLMDEGGLFVMNKGRAVLAVARENVGFTIGQVTEPGKPASVSVRLGTITATGTMLPGYAQRFETWKSAARTF